MGNCLYPCQKEGYNKVCNSEQPATLMHDMAVIPLKGMFDKLKMMGMDSMFTKECKVYAGMEAAGKCNILQL
jgi:hypothetical protein